MDIELSGKTISEPIGLYSHRVYLETLLTFNDEVAKSQLQCALWHKDTAGHMEEAGAQNGGFQARAAYFANGREVEVSGRIHADIFHQPKLIPQNSPFRIRFTMNRDAFVLMYPAPAQGDVQIQYRLKVLEAKLKIRTLQVSPATGLAHETSLQEANARFEIRRVLVKHLAIPQGQMAISHDNIYLGPLPQRIVLGLVSNEALTGSYQTNPFNFQHFNVNYLGIFVNGEMVPQLPFQPNFAQHKYLSDYNSLFEGTGTLFTDKSVCISRAEYPNGYCLWLFDLTPDGACEA